VSLGEGASVSLGCGLGVGRIVGAGGEVGRVCISVGRGGMAAQMPGLYYCPGGW